MVDWSTFMTIDGLLHPKDSDNFMARAILDALIPGHPFTLYDNQRKAKRYMDFYDMDYEDILYPSQAFGLASSIGSAGTSTLNFVSSNLNKLYK